MMVLKWAVNKEIIDVHRRKNGQVLFIFEKGISTETILKAIETVLDEYEVQEISYSTRFFSNVQTVDANKQEVLDQMSNYLSWGASVSTLHYISDKSRLRIDLLNA